MSVRTDERTLYELFTKLSNKYASKKHKNTDVEADKQVLYGITPKISLLAEHLNDEEDLVSLVKVSYIPREMNKKADRLGRSRMLLDMPMSTYNETVKKCAQIKELEKEIREKEEQIQILREQEEVIVVKQLVDLTTGSMTSVSESDTLFVQER